VPEAAAPRWLLLIHQIPPRPAYLRVKVGRRLQGLGAVAVKNSVYVLPLSEQAREDFQWVRREIVAGGGDATLCEARFVEGLKDAAVEALFRSAREADYAALASELRRLRPPRGRSSKELARDAERAKAALARLRKRLEEIAALDFFGASGRSTVEGRLAGLEAALRPGDDRKAPGTSVGALRGRTWVTRSGVHVDRIASAWLIRRFIDPRARFKFVRGQRHTPGAKEVRFDMFEAEFTHEGELCTFEVLRQRCGREEAGLREIGEIVHDIDLKDGKFGRPEALGLDRLIAGIAMRHKDDEARLRDGAAVFEGLYEYFRRKG
jgi:hypothetical protein